MSRIPHEIWSHIFSIELPIPSRGNLDDIKTAARRYQVAITSVCRAWRFAAQATPRLWRTVIVGASNELEDGMLRRLVMLSKGVSIRLVVESKYYAPAVVQLLLKRATHVFIIDSATTPELHDLNAHKAPRLLALHYVSASMPFFTEAKMRANLPLSPLSSDNNLALEEVGIWRCPSEGVGWDLQHLPRTLRRLTVDYVSMLTIRDADILHVFAESFPELDYLVVWNLSPENISTRFPPNLRTLDMSCECSFSSSPPLWFPPALVHLSVALNSTWMDKQWPSDYIDPPSLHNLRTLKISIDPTFAKSEVVGLLRRAPKLLALDIHWMRLYDLLGEGVKAKTFMDSDGSPLLTQLRLLRIRMCRYDLTDPNPWLNRGYADQDEEDEEADNDVETAEDDSVVVWGPDGWPVPVPSDFDNFQSRMRTFMDHQLRLPASERVAVEWWSVDDDGSSVTNPDIDWEYVEDQLESLEVAMDRFKPPGGAPWFRIGELPEWWSHREPEDWTPRALNRESCRHFADSPPPLSTLEWTET